MGAFEVDIATMLTVLLGGFVRTHGIGRVFSEMLFRIDPAGGLDRRPDLAYVSRERWPRGQHAPKEAAWEVVPDLAVEVISPTNSAKDVQDKVRNHFKAGVRAVWVIYPLLGLVHVYESPTVIRGLRVEGGDVLDGGDVVPGFRLPLAELLGEGAV